MKKNITINLYGRLYAIDEDACVLLEQYLDNMKHYFEHRTEGAEIADDIEHRVAELFAELSEQGVNAFTIDHVQEIIHRLGNPEEIVSGDPDEAEPDADTQTSDKGAAPSDSPKAETGRTEPKRTRSVRRLYRDPDDKMLGGVMSGLCHYFGSTDPLPWRILMVLLAFFSFSTCGILYLIAWAFIPQAVTAEQRLMMYGRPVNPDTLRDEVLRRGAPGDGSAPDASDNRWGKARGFLSTVLYIVVFLFKLFVLFVLGIIALSLLVLVGVMATVSLGGAAALVQFGMIDSDWAAIMTQQGGTTALLWGAIISGLVFAAIVIYSVVRSFLRRTGDRPLSTSVNVILVVVAVLSLAASLTMGTLSMIAYKRTENHIERENNMHDGHFIHNYDYNRLVGQGWQILSYDNCNDGGDLYHFTTSLLDGTSDTEYIEFERAREGNPMQVRLERTETHAPGYYHLEVIGQSEGNGAKVYVRTPDGKVTTAMLPMETPGGNGNFATMPLEEINAFEYFHHSLSAGSEYGEHKKEEGITSLRDRLEDWSGARSVSFYHPGGTLVVGTTNLDGKVGTSSDGSNLREYSIYDLRLVPDAVTTGTHTAAQPADTVRTK